MPFKYSCFISYGRGQHTLAERFITDLYEALSAELSLRLDKEIFLDWARLKGGDLFQEELAQAICQSVCMVVIYTPNYFSLTHTYCAREYKAMEMLEDKRLSLLPLKKREQGLIIPIVLRGHDYLPHAIREQRLVYDFSKFLLSERKMIKQRAYASQIEKLAEYVFNFYQLFDALSEDPCSNCATFTLPTEGETRPWLESFISPKLPMFPGREGTR